MKTFAAADGRKLAYDDEGQGEAAPVLCLPGLTRDARDFEALSAHLSSSRRVLRLDARGRGRSAHAADPMVEYTLPVETGDAIALLDHLGIEKAVVIGTSRGGLQAMGMAASAKDRLAGVVLNDIGPVVERAGLESIIGYIGVEPKASDLDGAARSLSRTLGDQYPDLDDEGWREMARRTFHFDKDGRPGLSYDARLREPVVAVFQGPQGDLWPFFEKFEGVPLACIRGALSNILSAETLEEMARRRPDMAHMTLPNRGHVPLLTEPEVVTFIDGFLANCP
ncbi:MAG: alpha/beta hydrolase [Pseudomonadota bacterium]